jgi:molybdopterin-guanine dinucleotide biosynthesis protein A
MGRDKAMLPFGPEVMLQRVVRLIGGSVPTEGIVVVAAPDQSLPALPRGLFVVHDAYSYGGPLEGLATGLHAMADQVDAAYATACDVPLLVPAFVDRMFDLLGEFDVAVPFVGERHHPLAAVYRPGVIPQIHRLLDSEQRSPRSLFDVVRTREISAEMLRAVDPQLSTLENLNFEVDYMAALAAAGLG